MIALLLAGEFMVKAVTIRDGYLFTTLGDNEVLVCENTDKLSLRYDILKEAMLHNRPVQVSKTEDERCLQNISLRGK